MRIIVIGAGPCGLGAAKRLVELGHEDWLLFEKESSAGGLSASRVDERGFTWDIGGHVVFSHYEDFDRMLEETCGGEWVFHRRRSFVKIGSARIPYPFQNNLHRLPEDLRREALEGLKSAGEADPGLPFDQWLERAFGPGITRIFMRPYNRKVWASDLSSMSSNWIAERVSLVGYEQARKRISRNRDDFDWGPNSAFRHPRRGGTGEIFRRLAAALPPGKVHFGEEIVRIDFENKLLRMGGGVEVRYDALINSIPLDRLVACAFGVPDAVREGAAELRHSGTHVVGCGFRAPTASDWSWMYFPEPDVPFHRVTNFGHYSSFNVPGGRADLFSALMCETSFSEEKPSSLADVAEKTRAGLAAAGLVDPAASMAGEFAISVPYAYPVPTPGRDSALRTIQTYLMDRGVYSRGRFGAWLYERGNMDHSYKQGRDVADRILYGNKEMAWKLS